MLNTTQGTETLRTQVDSLLNDKNYQKLCYLALCIETVEKKLNKEITKLQKKWLEDNVIYSEEITVTQIDGVVATEAAKRITDPIEMYTASDQDFKLYMNWYDQAIAANEYYGSILIGHKKALCEGYCPLLIVEHSLNKLQAQLREKFCKATDTPDPTRLEDIKRMNNLIMAGVINKAQLQDGRKRLVREGKKVFFTNELEKSPLQTAINVFLALVPD